MNGTHYRDARNLAPLSQINGDGSSLKPLGVPSSFKQTDEELRGGMTFRGFEVSFPDRKLRVTVYEEPDGKLEQYLVIPSGS